MNKLITILIISLIFGCKNIPENKKTELIEKFELSKKIIESKEELDFKKYLDKEIQYPLKKLNLKPITDLNSKILRIWRFPGGGAAFEQMLEFKNSDSELTFHSYLLEEFKNEVELSELNFSKKINEQGIIKELKSIISDSNFIETEDSEKYCEPFWGCADLYYVEFTNGESVGKFIINHNIEKCNNKKAENSKEIYKIMNIIIKKYSR